MLLHSHATARVFGLLLLGAALASAQDSLSRDKSATSVIAIQTNPRLKVTVSLNAKDANLSDVFKVLAEKSGMNFVSGEGANKEKVTVFLNQTPLDEAINILVRAAGLSYEIVGNSVLIAEAEKLKGDVGLTAYVVELRYASAPEVARMLTNISGKIQVDEGGNKLICVASPREIDEITKIVAAIDHSSILVMLETRVVEVTLDNLKDYGLQWESISPLVGFLTSSASSVPMLFSPDKVNVKLPDINAVLNLLVSKGAARILMNSRLTTTNNREANLLIGDIVPYSVQSYNLSGSGGVNLKIEKAEVGVKMAMTPHVNEDNQVTLVLEPELSSIVGFKGPNADIPQIRTRRTRTTVRVENGQTIVLAGLIQEGNTEEVRKLPLLGDIPILGHIFQHTKKTVTKTNLVIEVTPHIILNTAHLSPDSLGILGTGEDVKRR